MRKMRDGFVSRSTVGQFAKYSRAIPVLARARHRLLYITFAAISVSACSVTNLFETYPDQVNPSLQQLSSGQTPKVEGLFESKLGKNDDVLYLAERGRIAQISGNTALSIQNYGKVTDIYKERDRQAVLKASDAANQALAVVASDKLLPYEAEAFERTMLHSFQSVNYLLANDVENASPEARLADELQREALKSNTQMLDALTSEAKKFSIDTSIGSEVLTKYYAGIDEAAGSVKNSFQNPYAFYVGALVYEIHDEPTMAYSSIKNALELAPKNTSLQREAISMAKKTGMKSDLADYKKKFPKIFAAVEESTKGRGNAIENGQLVVVFEEQLVSQKHAKEVEIPLLSQESSIKAAFPAYEFKRSVPLPLTITSEGKVLGATEPLVQVDTLAFGALRNKIPQMVIRQLLQVAAKYAGYENETVKNVVSIYDKALDHLPSSADLRGWYSLPANVQLLEMPVSSGSHTLTLATNRGLKEKISVEVKPGKHTLIVATEVGSKLYLKSSQTI